MGWSAKKKKINVLIMKARKLLVTGFPAVREYLEKRLFLEKVRENLEKSGKFCKIPQKSGKSQGILFQNAFNLMVFSQSWNLPFSNFFLSGPTMVCPPNNHDNL